MNSIIIKKINLYSNILTVDYDIKGKIKKYFNFDNMFYSEYYSSINGTPEEILIIPFLVNVLPIIWLTNSNIYIDKLDFDFFESIEEIKNGFKKMYPNVEFKGRIIVKNIIKCNQKINKHSIFFSGGVDSVSSLFSVMNHKPLLITLWGSDIWEHDEDGWIKAQKIVEDYRIKLGLDSLYIKSNFRKFIYEETLNIDYEKKLGDTWWHGIQHGIGLIGHMAPYAYKYKIKTHYIPATYTEKDKNVKCASYPYIDESVKFCGCNIIHEGFNKSRQEKVKNIIRNFDNLNISSTIRVCFMERGNKANCCNCEKCFRTIMAFISQKKDPQIYGFDISSDKLKEIPEFLKNNKSSLSRSYQLWDDIKKDFIKNKFYWIKNKNFRWILFFNFKKYRNQNK